MADCRVLVLGGSSGIGLAFAELAVREPSFDVEVTAPNPETAAVAKAVLGQQVAVHVVDLLDVDRQTLLDLTAETDVLVLSAGLEYVGPIEFEPPGALEQMVSVNTVGPARVASSCVPGMIERGSGLIVGLGSVVTAGPRPFLAAYTASKAAFESYLGALAGEVRGLGVEVKLLRLGPVSTGLGSNGPANWVPDPASPYHDAYLLARADSERERTELMRSPSDVAEEILGLVQAFCSTGKNSQR